MLGQRRDYTDVAIIHTGRSDRIMPVMQRIGREGWSEQICRMEDDHRKRRQQRSVRIMQVMQRIRTEESRYHAGDVENRKRGVDFGVCQNVVRLEQHPYIGTLISNPY